MGETKLFEAYWIKCFQNCFNVSKLLKQHMLATPAGENSVKATGTQTKLTKQIEVFFK